MSSNENIRPQPSGETREVAFLIDRLADFENDINERDWHGHVAPAVARVKSALSTTPARAEAPSEDDARRRLIQRIEQWDGETEYDAEDIAALADDILHEFNGAPVVARAEAQDEGAAGEPVIWVSNAALQARAKGETVFGWPRQTEAFPLPLYAHPSPTPAADADRVRIAVEALEAERAWHERVADFAFDDAREASEREEETSERDAMRRMNAHNARVSIIDAALAALKSEGK